MNRQRKYFDLIKHPLKRRLFFKIRKRFFGFLHRCHLLSSVKLHINKQKIIVPIIKGTGLQNLDTEEPWMGNMIKKLYKLKTGAFIDVGVNLGQVLIQWKACKYEDFYYGFEPNPICYKYVMELIKQNRFPNCELFPVGLSDKNEVLKLFANGPEDSAASIVDGFRNPDHYSMKTNVAVFRGEDLLKKYSPVSISIIKIDVEGAELEVIRGLSETIAKYRPFILCEILPVYDEKSKIGRFRKDRQDALLMIIRGIKYNISRILQDGKLISLNFIESHSDLTICNYIFSPEEHVNEINNPL